ncbi:hypothetical protein C5167_024894 [Papaver somniferum]|uniref:Uncharacterized protein n=1 Tax=Papaver somniferum TaxID=3469 RepID=A0A4Y7JPV1_PAPSO|nr:hypothetical protein C5167_024894 [Papaver somniferum]
MLISLQIGCLSPLALRPEGLRNADLWEQRLELATT